MTTTDLKPTRTQSISNPLPYPRKNQKYVTVSPLAGGYITLSDTHFVSPSTPGAKRTVPSLAFLITHPGTQAFHKKPSKPLHLMFDLGLRSAATAYPEPLQKHLEGRKPHTLSPGVAAQLKAGGLDPADVGLVVLSHVHYDHHGDPAHFPAADFLVGHGALDVLANGLPGKGSHQHFTPDLLPAERTSELPPSNGLQWQPLGPFPAVLDLFNDGSVYVIDTPGHLPGHINLLCRTAERWVLLCGDAFHDRRLLTGEKDIGTWAGEDGGELCIHVDKEEARESIERLREFERLCAGQVELVAAHEEGWWEGHREKAFPGTI